MQWLEQNWLFVLLGAGVIFFMMRGGGMGCGMGGSGHGGHGDGQGGSPGGASPHDHGPAPMQAQAQAVDPVSGRPVDPSTAVSTVYRGMPVYFESRENRDQFEATPGQFALPQARQPQSHRHGGC